MKPFNSRVIVITPGIPRPLSDVSKIASKVHVAALAGNTTAIVLGGPDVRASTGSVNGLPMNGGTRPDVATFENIDLSQWWVDAATALEGISYLAEIE